MLAAGSHLYPLFEMCKDCVPLSSTSKQDNDAIETMAQTCLNAAARLLTMTGIVCKAQFVGTFVLFACWVVECL